MIPDLADVVEEYDVVSESEMMIRTRMKMTSEVVSSSGFSFRL
jgi:hypothetical protein